MWSRPHGTDWLACADGPLPVAVASEWVVQPNTGAAVTFVGTARDHAGERTGVHLLEYEAYEEMALPLMQALALPALAQAPLQRSAP